MNGRKAVYQLNEGAYIYLKRRMLNWAQPFSILLFLDSNDYPDVYGRYECILAVGSPQSTAAHSLQEIEQLQANDPGWLFGHIGYDYKNELESKLGSRHQHKTGFPALYFFRPEIVCYIDRDKKTLTIESREDAPDVVYKAILDADDHLPQSLPVLSFTKTVNKYVYLKTIERLRQHIADGDCYEINFCSEGYVEKQALNPLAVFRSLNDISPAPFAAYYRNYDAYMMSASPERYLWKGGDKLISQPIKGTAKRGNSPAADEEFKKQLFESVKERAENIMITDLVRSDLARSCKTGSIEVEELFGIYTFPQVHQMISTVTGCLKPDVAFTDAIRYSFPMGSMTGAPKVKVMQLIDLYEQSRRELFAGTVGYITPECDFDFNVIIRSLFYNAGSKYLSYHTGGAITYDSVPEQEWEEMQLKAWAMERIFS